MYGRVIQSMPADSNLNISYIRPSVCFKIYRVALKQKQKVSHGLIQETNKGWSDTIGKTGF